MTIDVKMTRSEAAKLIEGATCDLDKAQICGLLVALETLGVIKLKEQQPETQFMGSYLRNIEVRIDTPYSYYQVGKLNEQSVFQIVRTLSQHFDITPKKE
jgi:hypothetical protein